MAPSLQLHNIGQIHEADLTFCDLTVFVGPQASGKSIALQWLKLILDAGLIQHQLKLYGMDWHKQLPEFLDLYFGEGMKSLWIDGQSEVCWNNLPWDVPHKIERMGRAKRESVFLIPAQRVLTLRDGWPRPFSDYSSGDPFSVRWFSERLRLLMEQELGAGDTVFPKTNRLKSEYRQLLESTIFGRFPLAVHRFQSRKRLVLGQPEGTGQLPYMVWSAGQREFVPLLLGLYSLMPPAKVSMRDDIKWVIIEEPEMGMHPRAITVVLLLILELMDRGYRVCVSTHSPQVLDLVWALQVLRNSREKPETLLQIFEAPKTQPLRGVAERVLKKECKVYFFESESGVVHDITDLDPAAMDGKEASWGGMLEFSGRANQVVASAMANLKEVIGE